MHKIISFSRLIRLPNLLIILLTQYAMRWAIIYPMYRFLNKQLFTGFPGQITNPEIVQFQVSELLFFLLSISTVMIAAAGYIINDYFDVGMDRVNKPDQIIIDKSIKRREAMLAHALISGAAILIAGFASWKLGLGHYSLIYLAMAVGLWFYSTDFKKQLFTGNLMVALFVAMVPFVVGLYELNLCARTYRVLTLPPFEVNFKFIFNFIAGFSVLAFLINLIREIIKDVEDMEGDRIYGCKTIPIALGIETSKNIISFLSLLLILVIAWVQKGQYDSKAFPSLIYLLIFVQLPLTVLIYLIQKANLARQFKTPDILCKIIMLTGLLYSAVLFYSFISNA